MFSPGTMNALLVVIIIFLFYFHFDGGVSLREDAVSIFTTAEGGGYVTAGLFFTCFALIVPICYVT